MTLRTYRGVHRLNKDEDGRVKCVACVMWRGDALKSNGADRIVDGARVQLRAIADVYPKNGRLQLQVSDMFETLSRRSRSLVDQQLSLIDRLERNEEDPERLESRLQPGLHFIGEVLDLDGLIGGYNFQAAWSTGWRVGDVV